LGINSNINTFIPTKVLFDNQNKIRQISSGNYHNLILFNNGSIYSFGLNDVNYFLKKFIIAWTARIR
jgi:alpha-tubulin suppressor-like RCC1 family protein